MISDIITPAQRLSRLSPNRWEHRLSLLFFVIALLLTLALMCENVNATDTQRGLNRDLSADTSHSEPDGSATKPARPSSQGGASQGIAPILFNHAAPQYRDDVTSQVDTVRGSRTAGAAPFVLAHPLCQTGFTIAMRYDQRNSAGAIIKSVWVRKCVRVPKIIYGGRV